MKYEVRHQTIIVLVAVALAAALALGYLGVRGRAPNSAATVEKLSLALPTATAASLLHIAAERGYFADEGLDIAIVPVSHGKAAVEMLAEGKVDLAAASEVVFVLSVLKGADVAVAASMLSAPKDNAIVARRDRGIATPGDISGKRLGVSFGTAADYFIWAFLIRHRLKPESVALVDVPPVQIAQALAAGTVDAIATWQPIVFDAQHALGENAVSFTEGEIYTQTFVMIGGRAFLGTRSNAMEKLLRALLKAEQFARSYPEDAIRLVAGRLKVEVNALKSTWDDFDFRVDLMQSHLIALEDEARWAMARGYVAKGPVPNFLSNLYLDALLAVNPGRVTVVR